MTRDTALHAFVSSARWFGGKGRDFGIGEITDLPLGIHLVEIAYADGDREVYQVPLSSYAEPQERLAHALVGEWDDAFHYDAVHDRKASHAWLEAFVRESDGFHRLSSSRDHELDLETHSTLFSGEQSNSSLAFGDDSLLKLFRRITPGLNPDIEIHRALTEAGNTHIAQLYGWFEHGDLQLGFLQQFLRTAADGWGQALASVRVLFAEADLHPDEAGGDFASEAESLGVALAQVHAALRDAFPTAPLDVGALSDRLRGRLKVAAQEHPELAPFVAPLDARFSEVGRLASAAPAQRIHGDLHLGQTLRTTKGWKLVDFEGEPAKSLAERSLPDSPWRDIAGMLRSFDYAAATVTRDLSIDPEMAEQLAHRAAEWVTRTRVAFLAGYASVTAPLTDDDLALVEAYELDKAVYEVGYEARNRPDWIAIPLAALTKVGS